MGSGASCEASGCPSGELCSADSLICIDESRRLWSPNHCGSCAYFNAPDCCEAQGGVRYVALARSWEARAAPESEARKLDCKGGRKAVCLVSSICQDALGDALTKIATDLTW